MRSYATFMPSVLRVPFPRGDTAPPMWYQQTPLWRRETDRDAVVEEGPSVVFLFRAPPALIPDGSPLFL